MTITLSNHMASIQEINILIGDKTAVREFMKECFPNFIPDKDSVVNSVDGQFSLKWIDVIIDDDNTDEIYEIHKIGNIPAINHKNGIVGHLKFSSYSYSWKNFPTWDEYPQFVYPKEVTVIQYLTTK